LKRVQERNITIFANYCYYSQPIQAARHVVLARKGLVA
jgi:hypothetical protein